MARIFNTFGPRMHMNDGRVVSNFILQALQGEPLTVSAGLQARGECLLVQGAARLKLPLGFCASLPLKTRRGGACIEPEGE